MLRILILTHEHPPFRGGVATVAHGVAVGATALGYDTHVLAPSYHGDTFEWDAAQPYEIYRFPGGVCSILSLDRLTKFAARCHRAIRQLKPDIIHAVDPASHMALTALWKLRLVKSYFFTVHGSELLRYRRERFPRLWMRKAFTGVTGVSAVSQYVYDLLVNTFTVVPDRAFVAYPGISPHWFEMPATDRARVRSSWDVEADDFVLLTVARRVPDKGHQKVIEGVARLPERLRRRVVYVTGGPGPDDYARALAEQAKSESVRLLILADLSDRGLVEAYDAADAFIMLSKETPRRLEGLGLVYLEAGARGLPSIAARTGGVPEAVCDGETGLVLAAEPSALEVAEAIRRFAEDRELREEFGRRASQFAANFTWVRNAGETYERFSGALDSPR